MFRPEISRVMDLICKVCLPRRNVVRCLADLSSTDFSLCLATTQSTQAEACATGGRRLSDLVLLGRF
jgi:hypothetical protein